MRTRNCNTKTKEVFRERAIAILSVCAFHPPLSSKGRQVIFEALIEIQATPLLSLLLYMQHQSTLRGIANSISQSFLSADDVGELNLETIFHVGPRSQTGLRTRCGLYPRHREKNPVVTIDEGGQGLGYGGFYDSCRPAPLFIDQLCIFKGAMGLSAVPLNSLGRWVCIRVSLLCHVVFKFSRQTFPLFFSFHDLFSDGLYFIRVIFSTIVAGNRAHYAIGQTLGCVPCCCCFSNAKKKCHNCNI